MRTIEQLPSSTPEEQGISSAAILNFIDAIERRGLELHSLMLLRHGHVVAQGAWAPYRLERQHMLFSVSKSFTSTAVGLAIDEGHLSLDDAVLSFFGDDAPAEPGDNLRAMRVRHLLSMSTGHAQDTIEGMIRANTYNWAQYFLGLEVAYAPGTHFVYNSGASYMLSAIVQRVTGMTLLEYLEPRLFEPLGIQGATWESCPRGINTGGWGLSIRTPDIAAFGQLYLQQGEWQGRRLLPRDWVAQATSAQVANPDEPSIDWRQGYGFQFWRCRHNAYRGDGAFGQFCLVLPEQDAVLATTAGLEDMQAVLDTFWEHILPAMQPTALPGADLGLEQRLAALELPVLRGSGRSPLEAQLSGRTFVLEPNGQGERTVRFDFEGPRSTITFDGQAGSSTLAAGDGAWIDSPGSSGGGALLVLTPGDRYRAVARAAAGTGAWVDERTFELTLRYTATPFGITLRSTFDGDRVSIRQQQNVSFGPTELARLEGRLE